MDLAAQLFKMDITDPTSDGILTRVVTFGISALMVLVVLIGAWHVFNVWMKQKGGDSLASIRTAVFGVIIVEAALGGILVLANYGTSLLPSFGLG